MKLQHVFDPDYILQEDKFLLADIEGSHNDLMSLLDKLYDANELLDIKLVSHIFTPAIVAVKDEEGNTSLRYTNLATLRFVVSYSHDTAQALSDIASNILHLIE